MKKEISQTSGRNFGHIPPPDGSTPDTRPPLVIIAGPTAVGKSEAAVELALRIHGSVISADSMQVYRGMDIGTAKISPEQRKGIPHYLIDLIDPRETWNVVRFQQEARKALAEIYGEGRIPILCGGTGFYIQALLYGGTSRTAPRRRSGISRSNPSEQCQEGDPGSRVLRCLRKAYICP